MKAIATILAISVPILLSFNNCGGKFETGAQLTSSSSSSKCALAPEELRNPSTIEETTALINALPKPLTLNCFLENLARPLNVYATYSTFSAQASPRPESPRIFIVKPNFVLSIVPEGEAQNTLEIGQYISNTQSVKAEIVFPVLEDLSPSAPYDHILSSGGGGTSCRQCHIGEFQIGGFPGEAYASNILRPTETNQVQSSTLANLARNCNAQLEPHRCAILRAIFITGQARDAFFP